MAVLSVQGLKKQYEGRAVVNGIDLQVEPGECFGLLGPNGAGKTTTLRLCLGLIHPDAGQIRLLDHELPAAARVCRQRVGVVPQFDNLDPDFTVAENLQVYGRYFGLSPQLIQERIPGLLNYAGLAERGQARIRELSGGMKRRLTLARALINDPECVFLDEPTTGLDPQARHMIWDRLRGLAQQGKTLILTTHFMDEAERLCHRLAVMERGQIIAQGSPRDLIRQHIEPQVVEVYGEGTLVWLEQHGRALATRSEQNGETVFCYAHDPAALMASLAQHPQLHFLHRPANLEDVFLKLTGRELRD